MLLQEFAVWKQWTKKNRIEAMESLFGHVYFLIQIMIERRARKGSITSIDFFYKTF